MPTGWRSSVLRTLPPVVLAGGLAACADLGPVRDFGRSAAVASAYAPAAAAYVESARTSAAFVAGSPESFVSQSQRQAQVDDARALHAVVADYFATLARLAGDDDGVTLARVKAMATDTRQIGDGSFDRTTIDAYVDLSRTLARWAEAPARESAVRALVRDGGPAAMRIVESLRRVAVDWRAQVANDAKQVDDLLGIAVLPADVAPLLRVLATDRRAELSRSYAATLRQMRAADTALAAIEKAHAELAARLADPGAPASRLQLQGATAGLRAAAADAGVPPWIISPASGISP